MARTRRDRFIEIDLRDYGLDAVDGLEEEECVRVRNLLEAARGALNRREAANPAEAIEYIERALEVVRPAITSSHLVNA